MTVDDAAFVEKMAEREEVGIFGSPWVSLTRKERDRLAALARLAVNEANTAPGDLNRLSCGCWFRACSKAHEDSIAGEAQQRLADAEKGSAANAMELVHWQRRAREQDIALITAEARVREVEEALRPFAEAPVAGDTFLVNGADVNRARAALARRTT